MCGSKRIEVQRVEKRIKGRPAVAVEAEVCLNCGERYYARQAVEAILNAGKK
jgi:hypothetical protein